MLSINKKYIIKNKKVFVLMLSLWTVGALAQTSSNRFSQIDAGYAIGGSGDGFFFALDHGVDLSLTHGIDFGNFALLGGAGYQRFDRNSFIPVFLEGSIRLGKKGNGQLRLRSGHAFAQSEGPADLEEYNLRGGGFIAPAYGLKLWNNKTVRLTAWFGYLYQRSTLQFQPFNGGQTINSLQHYHLFSIKIGGAIYHAKK